MSPAMSAIVFVGPSLYGKTLELPPGIVLRPPAAQGDIFRACRQQPRVIGLIDGYFEGVPSVWHKEILWALANGIAVYGSASMGALRAAELDVFGMTGIGRIYEWYRDGLIEDDDEVALLHGPAEARYVPLSEPSVNVRASCAAAVDAQVIDQAAADIVVMAARSLHYKERQWPAVLERAGASGLAVQAGKSLAPWLDRGKFDQKQRDAIALIDAVAADLDHPRERPPPNFRFEWTDVWDQVVGEWDAGGAPPADARPMADAVIDELRLDADAYVSLRAQALARAMALAGSDGTRSPVDRSAKLAHLARLRDKLGLMRKADFDQWAARNGLDEQALEALLETEARIEEARRLPAAVIDAQILALLYLNDSYAGLAARAEHKQRMLQSTAFTEDGLPHGLSIPLLLNWYFVERRKQPVPERLDPLIEELGLASRAAFYRLLAAEYVYSTTETEN
jgi:hypothetical protein